MFNKLTFYGKCDILYIETDTKYGGEKLKDKLEKTEKITQEIKEYTVFLLHMHDLDANRNTENRHLYERIVEKCCNDLIPDVVEQLENKQQIQYFVRQSILYLAMDR